jgi:hypothetical protein
MKLGILFTVVEIGHFTNCALEGINERKRLITEFKNFRGVGESRVGLCIPAIAALPTPSKCKS